MCWVEVGRHTMFLKDRILKMLNFLYKTAGVSSGWFLRPVNILSGCYTDTVMNLSAQLRHLSSYIIQVHCILFLLSI